MIREARLIGFGKQKVFEKCTCFILLVESVLAIVCLTMMVVSLFYTNKISSLENFVFQPQPMNIQGQLLTHHQGNKIILHLECITMMLLAVFLIKNFFGFRWYTQGRTRGLFINFFSFSVCFYTYSCYCIVVLNGFEFTWVSDRFFYA